MKILSNSNKAKFVRKNLLSYMVFGPIAPALIVISMLLIEGLYTLIFGTSTDTTYQIIMSRFLFSFLIVLGAYIIGVIPAAITSLIHSLIAIHQYKKDEATFSALGRFQHTLLGFIACIPISIIPWGISGFDKEIAVYVIMCIFAATICGYKTKSVSQQSLENAQDDELNV